MQRKRTRTHYSDNIELGSNIIPVSKGLMRKLKMKSLLKYAAVGIVCFMLFSIYEKISRLSNEDAAEIWSKGNEFVQSLNKNHPARDTNIEIPDHKEDIDRRVKEEINKVFQEFKEKQEREEAEALRDPWRQVNDGQNQQNNEPDNTNQRDQFPDGPFEKFEPRQRPDDPNGYDKDFQRDQDRFDGFDNVHGADVLEMNRVETDPPDDIVDDFNDDQAIDNGERGQVEDMGDHYEEVMGNIMDIINEDAEKEELEIEDEIEHRLAEVLKDAVNEVADEQADQVQEDPLDVNVDNVDLAADPIIPEKKEFKEAVNQMGEKLNPIEVQRLNEKAIRDEKKKDDDHEFPPFVTAAGSSTYLQVTQLVASLQSHMPGKKIYIYDLDLTPDQKKHLMSYCGVRMRRFMKSLFPDYVQNLSNLHWKPLVIQTALAEFGHVTWINPQYRLNTQNLGPVLHDSHETGIMIIGQFASYSTYSATNPKMYEFIPSNKDRLANSPHVEIRAIIIHNTPEVHDNVMKLFSACALEQNCLAPPGSKWSCTFDFTGKKPAGCHRYDESAINILLKNWFQFDMDKFARRNSYFRDYDQHYKPNLKLCRSFRDIRDTEL